MASARAITPIDDCTGVIVAVVRSKEKSRPLTGSIMPSMAVLIYAAEPITSKTEARHCPFGLGDYSDFRNVPVLALKVALHFAHRLILIIKKIITPWIKNAINIAQAFRVVLCQEYNQ
jgi:hypothetical protein